MPGRDAEALRRVRHDLRSPLVVIGGFAQLLASDRPLTDEQRRDYAQRIQNAARDMERLLDTTLAD